MMWRFGAILGLGLFCAAAGAAQESEPAESGAPSEKAKPLTGDIITLNSGKVLSGVQVIRRSPQGYEVEVVKGIAPLLLPRTQVKSIEFDDIEPLHEQRRLEQLQANSDEAEIAGKRITPELRENLRKTIPNTPLHYEEQDLVTVMQDLCKRCSVQLHIDESVKRLRPGTRLWTLDVPAGKTLMSIIQNDFPKRFDQLMADIKLDAVTLITKDAAGQKSENPSPPSGQPNRRGPGLGARPGGGLPSG